MDNDTKTEINDNPIIDIKECYVAFLDILGFKDIIKKWEPDIIKELFNDICQMGNMFKSCRSMAIGENSRNASDYFNACHKGLFVYIMSDSIVMAIESDTHRKLHFLLYACNWIQQFFFEKAHIIVRGGVSKGWFYGNGSVAFGEGFVNAYKLEGVAKYPRIIIDPNLYEVLEDSQNDWSYDVIKDDDYWCIDWLKYIGCTITEIKKFCNAEIEKSKELTAEKEQKKIEEKYQWILDRLDF